MPKPFRQANTRIATTVNARYYPTDDIVDGYFLDGRFPNKRELRAVDVTLDREDRGAVLAIYGRPQDEDTAWQDSLVTLVNHVKEGQAEIDDQLNVLAEASLEIVGRQTLANDSREAYFAGVMVQDGEAVAITLGDGGAYLYRGDFLYALTNDDYPIEAIDLNGNAVDLVDTYAAGSAGTVRYSNIVSLEQNDALIVCNKDVLEAVGQREFMRLLYEAEDANEAAGLIITAASAKSPGVPMQIGIGFVEYVVPLEKKPAGLNLGRFATASVSQADLQAALANDAKTQQFNPNLLSRGGSGTGRPDPGAYKPQAQSHDDAPTDPLDLYAKPEQPAGVSSDTDRYSRMAAESFGLGKGAGGAADGDLSYAKKQSHFDGAPGFGAYQNDDDAAFETAPTPRQKKRKEQPRQEERHIGIHDLDDTGAYEDYDDYDDLDDRGRTKKIVVLVLLGAIILISLYALIRLLVGGGGTTTTESETTVQTTISTEKENVAPPIVTPGPDDTSDTPDDTKEPTPTPTTTSTEKPTPEAGSVTHVVTADDSWYSLALKYYQSGEARYYDYIAEANGKTSSDNIYVGDTLTIPPKPSFTD